MSEPIREYQGPEEQEPVVREYKGSSSTLLDDSQVEALIEAIESSPLNTNGKTSELAIQAALYLTGDEPEVREQEFADQLAQVNDVPMLRKELAAFRSIYRDFAASTTGEEDIPQVAQTRQRLSRIVSMLAEAIDYSQQLETDSTSQNEETVDSAEPSSVTLKVANKESAQKSIFESNWFRFAAFSVLAVIILLAIVMLVQWLRVKHETSQQASESKSDQSAKSDVLI